MTLPYEEAYAVNATREFLRVLSRSKLKDIKAREVRDAARRLLKHYPFKCKVDALFVDKDV